MALVFLCCAPEAFAANGPTCPPGELLESVKKLADPKWEGRGLGSAGFNLRQGHAAKRLQGALRREQRVSLGTAISLGAELLGVPCPGGMRGDERVGVMWVSLETG